MATQAAPVTPDTPITIKLQHGVEHKRTKLPLKDLVPGVLPAKLTTLLALPANKDFVFERFSDSAGAYVKLDDFNPSVYKQLHRAAKAKLKLRIRVNAVPTHALPFDVPITHSASAPRASTISALPTADPGSLNLADLHISSQPSRPTSVANNSSVETLLQTKRENGTRQENVLSRQLDGLNSYLDEFRDNMASDYSATFGGQLPNFLDAPSEPNMPRYPSPPFRAFSVCCNNCNFAIAEHHWHCSICQEGDFDLCQACLDDGHHCEIPEHFLIRRRLVNGKIVIGETEIATRSPLQAEAEPAVEETSSKVANEVPGAFSTLQDDEPTGFSPGNSRTCNSCISIYDDSNFVTCKDCDDYDLCVPCHLQREHGHHPGHSFGPAIGDMILEDVAAAACEPGRNQRHDAVCDGCDEAIVGVRHKCQDCPDFDYCSTCHKSAEFIHAGHRFAPLYEPLPIVSKALPQVHSTIRCDGPLCTGRQCIIGDRYKCAICHDTDFCANCEALPSNPHNRTHPLIKFRTPVRNVNVTTVEEQQNGGAARAHGDRHPQRSSQTNSRGTETTPPAPSANASTQAEAPRSERDVEEAIPTPVHVENIEEAVEITEEKQELAPKPTAVVPVPDAYYVRDYVPDGTKVLPNKPVFQTWTMYNPSGTPWPAGCELRWVGGDSMLDVDTTAPGSMSVFEAAASSNATISEVPRGAEYSFSVKLRSPDRGGRAVSYWRLYTPDGTPFGHRLWCDIEVVEELADMTVPPPAAKTAIKTEVVKDSSEELSESQMVFPKLEKESPASSTHLPSSNAPSQANNAQASQLIAEEAEELLSHDDVESVTVDYEMDDDTTDDGFLTDEEYDMMEEELQH